MRQRRTFWTIVILGMLAAMAAAWWTADQWLPHATPWVEQALKKATRPGPESLPQKAKEAASAQAAASEPPPRPRKCVNGSQITYTDQPCPPGAQERSMDGGAVTSLPR